VGRLDVCTLASGWGDVMQELSMISICVWQDVGMSGWCYKRAVVLGAAWVALEW